MLQKQVKQKKKDELDTSDEFSIQDMSLDVYKLNKNKQISSKNQYQSNRSGKKANNKSLESGQQRQSSVNLNIDHRLTKKN